MTVTGKRHAFLTLSLKTRLTDQDEDEDQVKPQAKVDNRFDARNETLTKKNTPKSVFVVFKRIPC
jgi:hypothetical protein